MINFYAFGSYHDSDRFIQSQTLFCGLHLIGFAFGRSVSFLIGVRIVQAIGSSLSIVSGKFKKITAFS